MLTTWKYENIATFYPQTQNSRDYSWQVAAVSDDFIQMINWFIMTEVLAHWNVEKHFGKFLTGWNKNI